ncbi:MAG: DUF4270 family protein [Flavobacteriales bacterium]|jgi:hypothetical protein|nr:DUF4270 domain-containing protein [Flavobacteriales bacterium]|tara:strand:+ start:3208 stop:4452 length:1245 start_codon:yes stop_codon:yes gene_type:complete
MKVIYILALISSFLFFSCSDSNVVGLEIQPNSDIIEIFNGEVINEIDSLNPPLYSLSLSTHSEDSLRTDETTSLLLGSINDPIFGLNEGSFLTQISLSENNVDLGENPVVDSVVFSYSYSGYYGDLTSPTSIAVKYVDLNIYKDSVYYSNHQFSGAFASTEDLLLDFTISSDTSISPILKMTLDNSIGQQILDLGNSTLVDNETFQQNFGCFSFNEYSSIANSIIYLNPSGSNSNFTIYYHNSISDTLSLSFALDGDAARINLFNDKPLSNLNINSEYSYVQSMSGFRTNIEIENLDNLRLDLAGKSINHASLNFNVTDFDTYSPHDKLFLVRENSEGSNVFLTDFTIEGDSHFKGELNGDSYDFNISRYFHKLLNDTSYSNKLILISSGGAINAHRTIILNNSVKMQLIYSEL